MKISCLFKSKVVQFSFIFLCGFWGTLLYASEHSIKEWEILENKIRNEQDNKCNSRFEKIAKLYVSMNSRSKDFQEIYDKEYYLLRKNIAGCLVYGAATGCVIHTEHYKKDPTISMINTAAFFWFLFHTSYTLPNYTHLNYSLNNYNQLKELIRTTLIEKLGEEKTLLIDSLTTSDDDLKELHALLQESKPKLGDDDDWSLTIEHED